MTTNPLAAYHEALRQPPVANLERTDVEHVCPECGGPFADHLNASGLVVICWACKGKGTLTNDQLYSYMAENNRRVRDGES